jgi:fructokinase
MKILSFGEIIWDVYPDKNYIGGAPLNFAAHASREGADAYLLSAVGNDELGFKAVELVKKFGVFTDYVSVNPDFETGKCIVSLDENGVPSFNVKNNAAYDNIVSVPDEYFDVVAFGTLAMRNSVSLNTLKKLLKAKKYDKIFCDINLRAPFYTKENVELCLENANILKLSDTELDYVFDTFFNIRYENLVQNFYLLCSKYPNIEEITVTYGEGGAYAFSKVEDKICYAPVKQVDVVSTVGAGDSFGASYLVSRLKGKSIEQSLKRATEVSAYVVSCKDAIPMEE